MKSSLSIALVISLSLASCAKRPTTRITVKVDEQFSGHVRLSPCAPEAKDPVVLDERHEGFTSACPPGDVVIVVIKPSKSFEIAAENVHVRRGRDGAPVLVSAEIP
jgi:hypothetical protein